MAMIECPECGKRISTMAPACPGCGILQSDIQKMLADSSTVQKQNGNAEIFENLIVKSFSKVSLNYSWNRFPTEIPAMNF